MDSLKKVNKNGQNPALLLLLWAQVVGVTTLGLSAVGSPRVQSSVALAADHLVAVVLLGQNTQRRLDDTSSQTQYQMEGGFLLDVVVGEGPAIFELLSGEDQSLLVWGNAFLVLDLGFDVFDGVRGLDL
ncbi:hypothetical protein JTB14_034940 [Gonioctena quinquepunctata]|nr:hypothetical protein JTB14_034940 [Gonioctena quinquepunctata]